MMNITIRPETRSDHPVIGQINDLAFGRENEGQLVELLRKRKEFDPELSILAVFEGQAVGHLLLFPVVIRCENKIVESLGLGPMAVMPEFQSMGIGSLLVNSGILTATRKNYRSIIVLGHENFYPRFGFLPASRWNISALFQVKDENFMAKELQPDSLANVKGVVEYPVEFNVV